MIQIYTDGSCDKQGFGGWAFAVTKDGKDLLSSSGELFNSSNNKAELQAVIEALKLFKSYGEAIEIISDSAYVINCFISSPPWYENWYANNWISSAGTYVKNREYWETLLAQVNRVKARGITWKHVKGHNGDKFNEHCDKLAGEARLRAKEKGGIAVNG